MYLHFAINTNAKPLIRIFQPELSVRSYTFNFRKMGAGPEKMHIIQAHNLDRVHDLLLCFLASLDRAALPVSNVQLGSVIYPYPCNSMRRQPDGLIHLAGPKDGRQFCEIEVNTSENVKAISKSDPAELVENLRVSGQNRSGRTRSTTGDTAQKEGSQSVGGISHQ